MKNKVIFYYSNLSDEEVLFRSAPLTQTKIAEFMTGELKKEASNWGTELFCLKDSLYKHQISAEASELFDGRIFLRSAEQALEDDQRLEFYSADSEYDTYTYCEQRHFAKGGLSGTFSGVKFRGRLEDILLAYDDIMDSFGSLRLHMTSISCAKNFDGLTAEIQLEYDDYIVEKEFFTKIVSNHPSLRMMAISIPEGRWENWFFFTSGGHSTSIKAEEIRYERTADPDYYWAKATYFDEDDWLLGDFIFVERERRTDVYPNVFNWSETLEYPSNYWGKKSLRFCAVQTRHAKKIVLPDVAQYIIGRSFTSCANLKEIVMPSVTKINREAFFSCKALKKLVVSEKLVCVEDMAFVDCGNFKVEAPSGSYAEKYFGTGDECTDPDFVVKNGVLVKYTGKVQTVIVPDGVREIGETVFYGNKKVFEVVLPNSVETIRKGAFYECVNLEKITLSEGLKTIGEDAFSQCTQLHEITISESVVQIDAYAFYGCGNLTAVSIPEGITTIADSAFAECKNLQKVIFPESIRTIESQAFARCKNLADITIPQNVASIGDAAFIGCSALTAIDIPPGVTQIGFSAFQDCKNLARVSIPDVEITYGTGAFSGCRKLADKKKMVIIANILFDYFGHEEHVVIPDGVIALGDQVLNNIQLESATIPESVIAIGPYTFPSWNEDFILYAPAGSYAEKYAKENGLNFVAAEFPQERLPEQKAILRPNARKSKQQTWVTEEQSDGTLMIADYKGSEKEVYIPEQIDGKTVSAIGENAFSPMKPRRQKVQASALANLTTVVLPPTLRIIGNNAFQGCERLMSVEIPGGVLTIGEWAFAGCKNMDTISFSQSIQEIGKGAFSDCKKLHSVVLPDGIKEISAWVFYDCANLTSVYIPDSVENIGALALQKCPKISICASAGSYAETYAKEKKIKFEALETTIEKLPEHSKVLTPKKDAEVTDTDTLAGKTFVVTGDLYHYASRDVLKGIIEAKGGKLTGSISGKTTALITNFPDSGTTKIQKARQLGIEIITEEEFLRCYLSEESEDTSKSIQPELEEDTEPQAVGPRAWETLFLPWILERGRDYADQGKVSDIRKYPGKVCARIMGQDSYDISITYNEIKEIQNIQCTCPYAAGANYCKHSAALLYAIDLDLKPLAETEDWYEFEEESDLNGERTEIDEVEDDFDGDGEEYVSFNLILGIVPDFDTTFNGVVKMIKSFLSNVHGAKSWSKGIQADRKNGEIIIEEDLLSHDTYEAIFPKICEEIAKKYPDLLFQGVAEYSELRGDSGEVCLVRYFENKLSVLNIASGCRLAICPECDADVMSLVELAETLINDPDATLVCEDCGAEFTPQELFEDDWGLSPNWVINTYDMTEIPSSTAGSAVCTQTDILGGKTFVVTGDLYHYASRDVLKGIIEARGGKLTGSISSKTTALITNFPDSGTTKIQKARQLGIEIITEEEFIHRYLKGS